MKTEEPKDQLKMVIPEKKCSFPGNIIVLKMKRDEFRSPIGYEEMEVPEELAIEQLAKPIGQRAKAYQDICFVKDADPRFFN